MWSYRYRVCVGVWVRSLPLLPCPSVWAEYKINSTVENTKWWLRQPQRTICGTNVNHTRWPEDHLTPDALQSCSRHPPHDLTCYQIHSCDQSSACSSWGDKKICLESLVTTNYLCHWTNQINAQHTWILLPSDMKCSDSLEYQFITWFIPKLKLIAWDIWI